MLKKTKQNQHNNNTLYLPHIYSLKNTKDKLVLKELIENNPQLLILDEIESQVRELIKIRHPQKPLSEEEYQLEIQNHYYTEDNRDEYGVWVYYPWSDKLVNMIDEKEFVTVRTNRNQYKITPEEKQILSTKKICLIGLSVGQSIALTIAMERICGEIRIIYFDIL